MHTTLYGEIKTLGIADNKKCRGEESATKQMQNANEIRRDERGV